MWHNVREVDDGFVIRCCGRDLLLLSPQREGRPQGAGFGLRLELLLLPRRQGQVRQERDLRQRREGLGVDDIAREGERARVVVSYPTQSREPVVCEAEGDDPEEALRGCVT
jgi:hypothetical protein